MKNDIIVVGGGHAGCEAALACSKMGHKTLLITGNISNIADMPCNPSIGGTAKGIIVREIDALGGTMGIIADKAHFQIKMLNNAKGPAVRSLRAQADKEEYPKIMLDELNKQNNLEIKEAMVEDLLVEQGTVFGVILNTGEELTAKKVILTTGTYLNADILVGDKRTPSGPHGEARSNNLSDNLKKYGINIQRLKTGTPPRIKHDSIDFSSMQEEDGDIDYYTFSFDNEIYYNAKEQEKCYLIYTNKETHEIINNNLEKSSMYGGYVEGIGPRYCPSIEDKVVRFADKDRHQLFLEPESKLSDEWYLQGFSTSMPYDIQDQMIHSLQGLEKAVISKYAYAIEYDAIDPLQMKASLESKIINNLYTAGQINGTSGYEEAAAQGLIAGINASRSLDKKESLILKRNEAYIGVLIDDLVTKGTKEPYRMLTSRAEFRLLLRHDNADLRLMEYGHEVGLILEEKYNKLIKKKKDIASLIKELREMKLDKNFISEIACNKVLYEFLKRPEITFKYLEEKYAYKPNYSSDVIEQVEITTKYEGYITKTYRNVDKMLKTEEKQIPLDIDYDNIKNLASEARQKLKEIRPISIGQATRISGVNPSDIAILMVYLKKEYGN